MTDSPEIQNPAQPGNIAEKISHFVLGTTVQGIDVDGSKDLSTIINHMAAQARRSIRIFTRHMDAPLYDNNEFINILKKLARDNSSAAIEILVQDSTPAVKNGHRLIRLSQDLSSYVHIRKVHKDYKNYNHAFMIADTNGIIFRELADRYEASIDYCAPIKAKELGEFFRSVWECSEQDSQLRRLHI